MSKNQFSEQERKSREGMKQQMADLLQVDYKDISYAVDTIWANMFDILTNVKCYRQEIPGYVVFRFSPIKQGKTLAMLVKRVEIFTELQLKGSRQYTKDETRNEVVDLLNQIDHIIYTYCYYLKNIDKIKPDNLAYEIIRSYKKHKQAYNHLQSLDLRYGLANFRQAFKIPGLISPIYMQELSEPPPPINYQAFKFPLYTTTRMSKVRVRDQSEDPE